MRILAAAISLLVVINVPVLAQDSPAAQPRAVKARRSGRGRHPGRSGRAFLG
jgi:hypothetical protein